MPSSSPAICLIARSSYRWLFAIGIDVVTSGAMVGQSELDATTCSLVEALASAPTSQLAILVTQHAALAHHTTRALRILAREAIEDNEMAASTPRKTANLLADLLRRLVARGDPSLARRLVPSQATLIDLALCTDARDLLARLVDVPAGARELIKAPLLVLERVTNEVSAALERPVHDTQQQHELGTQVEKLGRAAFVLGRVIASVPLRTYAAEANLRKKAPIGKSGTNAAAKDGRSEDIELLTSTLATLREAYARMGFNDGKTSREHLATLTKVKVKLLDAAWATLERAVVTIAPDGTKVHSDDFDLVWKALDTADGQRGTTAFQDSSLPVDLALVRPVIPLLKSAVRAPRVAALEPLDRAIGKIMPGSNAGSVSFNKLGARWESLLASLQGSASSNAASDAVLSSVLAVLPHLEVDVEGLKARLSEAPYAGKNAEATVQMLLDENDNATAGYKSRSPGAPASPNGEADAFDVLRSRANVFDDEPLDNSKVLRRNNKGREVVNEDGLSEELRARILARAEAPDSDEEDREEWDPFASTASRLEVGFEDELEGGEESEYRLAMPSLRQGAGDGGHSEEEFEEGESDGVRGGAGHGTREPARTASSSLAAAPAQADRATERILITAMKEDGDALFAREARKTAARASLLKRLNELRGKAWDDQLVESWATMFARNVRVLDQANPMAKSLHDWTLQLTNAS